MAEDTQKFYGVKLTDATGKVYYTEVNVKQDLTHNINIQTHKPISSKFPYSTIIGKNNYWSGTLSGAFENNQTENVNTTISLETLISVLVLLNGYIMA